MAHLPDALVERLLADDSFQPGGRPTHFRAVVPDSVALVVPPPSTIDRPGPAVGWLFKETALERQRRRHAAADRWRNCGGVAGARDLPAARPVLRRRYGKLTPAASNGPLLAWCAQPKPAEKRTAVHRTTRPTAKEGFAYHEYTLLDRSRTRQDGAFEDNVSAYLFHVVPVRDAMAEAPRLGLPESVTLTPEESRSLSAILRVEGFGEIPGLDSVGSTAQLAINECGTLLHSSSSADSAMLTATGVTRSLTVRFCLQGTPGIAYGGSHPTHLRHKLRAWTPTRPSEAREGMLGLLLRRTVHEFRTVPRRERPSAPGHLSQGVLRVLVALQHGWLFKEPGRPARPRRGQHEDRWKHSGGQKGAKDLFLEPTVRRTAGHLPYVAWLKRLLSNFGVARGQAGCTILDANAQAMCSRPVVRRCRRQPHSHAPVSSFVRRFE